MKLIFTLLKQTLFTTSLALSQYICGHKIFVGLCLIGSYRSRCYNTGRVRRGVAQHVE